MKIQRLMFKENLRAAGLVTLLGLASCAIDNDIPYPLVEGTISEIVTEGLRASEDGTVASGVDIDRSARTVTLYVNDSVDDQIEWLDESTLIFQITDAPLVGSAQINLYTLDMRGVQPQPRLWLEDAKSPTLASR